MLDSPRCELCGDAARHTSAHGLDVCDRHLVLTNDQDEAPERTHDWLSGQPLNSPNPVEEVEVEEDPGSTADTLCQSFNSFLNIKFFPPLRAWMDDENPYVAATITATHEDGWIDLDINGEPIRRWTHSPQRLTPLAEHFQSVTVNLNWSTLKLGPGYVVSITSAPTPCVYEDPTGTLVEQLETHGGFLIPGTQAIEELGRPREV